MNKKVLLCVLSASIVSFTGCTTVAELAGGDSASLNMAATQGFNKTVQDAQSSKTLDTTSSTYKRIYAVFKRMTPYADQVNQTGQKFDWKLAVLKSDTVNAYVAPGGKVVFYTGIVNKLNLTDDEIAAVMGHEMTHALEEHSKQKMGASVLTNLAVGVGKTYVGSAAGGLGGTALDLGSQIGVGLPYSRNLESRADQGGLMLMAKAGYNPNSAVTLWEKMAKLPGAKGSALLSTHPSDENRIAAMRKNLPAALQVYNSRR